MRRLTMGFFVSIWLMCLLFVSNGQMVNAKGKVPLRIGYLPILTQMPLIVSYENDWMNFSEIQLSLSKYNSFTSLEAALRVGAIDVASIPLPIALSIAADGHKINIIGAIHQGGSRLVAKAKGDLKSVKSQLVGVPGLDSNENLTLNKVLSDADLRPGLDFKTIEIPFNSVIKDLKSDRLNSIYLPEPYGTIAENEGVGFELEGQKELLTGTLGTVLVIRSEVLEKHGNAAKEWLVSLVKSCRFIEKDIKESGANQIAIIQVNYLGLPKDTVTEILTKRKGGLKFDQLVPSFDEIRECFDTVSKMKMVNKSVDLKSLVSLDLIGELSKEG